MQHDNYRNGQGRIISRTYTILSVLGRPRQSTQLGVNKRPIHQQVGNLTATAFGYDSAGRLTGVTQGSRSTAITYDTAGDSVTDAANRTVSFDYDGAGRVTTQTLPDLRTITLQYDRNGNVTSITTPGPSASPHTLALEIDAFIVGPEGTKKRFRLAISEPMNTVGEEEFSCLVHAPELFRSDKRIFGATAEQARQLAIEVVKRLVAGKRIVDHDGKEVQF